MTEHQFYQRIRASALNEDFNYYRIENAVGSGFPDILLTRNGGPPIYIEAKVSHSLKRVKLERQQVWFHEIFGKSMTIFLLQLVNDAIIVVWKCPLHMSGTLVVNDPLLVEPLSDLDVVLNKLTTC